MIHQSYNTRRRQTPAVIGLMTLLLITLPSVAATALPASRIRRPRLFFTAKRIDELRQRIEKEGPVKDAWENILKRADRTLDERLVSKEYADGGSGQHGNYGRPSSQIANMAGTLGLAYQMTGQKRYADKLTEALLHYGTLRRWAGDAKREPPWNSELNTARFCYGYAVGYDSIHDCLSPEDRQTIARDMIRLGILPTLNDWVLGEKRIHALDSMGHNWWSVCVSMAGLASLSLIGDEPQAETWVKQVSEAFDEWFYYTGNVLQNKSINFDRHGAFYESVSYANYALSEYLLFRLACSNTPGKPPRDIGHLEKAGDFFVNTAYPTSDSVLSVNFGDSSTGATGARTVRLLLANGYEADQYHWYLDRTDQGLGDPVGLVYYEPAPSKKLPADFPTSVIYPDIGWAVLRSSWENDATMLAVKSGFAWNHAHPDAGSFILFHGGRPLIIDSGNCSYSRREYTSYYRQSKAHNVILLDGRAQNPEDCGGPDRGVKTPGKLHHLLDAADLKYLYADATGPTSWLFSRNYRHFLWIGGVILIFDDVRAHEAGKLEWLLHYEGQAETDGPDIRLSNGDRAKAIVRPLFPEDMTIAERKGLKDHSPDTEVAYLALSPRTDLPEAKFVTAILPTSQTSDRNLPKLSKLEGRNMVGARVEEGGSVTDVYLNLQADGRRMHRNSNNVIDGWETDAYLFAVTRAVGADPNNPDSAVRYFVACGSYLRKDGRLILDCLSKVYTVFTGGRPDMQVQLQGQPLIKAAFGAAEKPLKVTLNGSSVPVSYDAEGKTVTLRLDNR
jgi:hypothetical protein